MKNNEILQKQVQDAIKAKPILDAAEIGVIVKDGVVTLSGNVKGYSQKNAAEEAAKKVDGVKAIANDIEVIIGNRDFITDKDIAKNAVRMIEGSLVIPKDKVKIVVENGWVKLDGILPWSFQKEMAWASVKDLQGVKGVVNSIIVESEISKI